MRKFWETQSFQRLEKEWHEKLKSAGFKDEEKKIDGDWALKHNSSCYGRFGNRFTALRAIKLDPGQIEQRSTYYLLLSQRLNQNPDFMDESDRIIMQKTAEGWSIREISDELKRLKLTKFNRDTIRYVRRRYEHKWGIRQWMPIQMVSRKAHTR